jgi:uncharacterized delta-60 repeat protein
MRWEFNRLKYRFCIFSALSAIGATTSSGAPFGLADSAFNSPRFTARCYPEYCFADGHGGLLWSFVNTIPGDMVGANGQRVGGLVRTTADGLLDTNFVVSPNLQESFGVAFQADGKILVGGRWIGDLADNGAPNYRVFRLLTNGVADLSYHSPVFGFAPRFMTVQPDGKLLVGTTFLSGTPAPNGGIVDFTRLNSDGSQDAGFHQPALTGSFAVFAPPLVDTNGGIYIAGGFSYVDGQSRAGVARLLVDGTLDPAFVPSGYTFSQFIRGVVRQPDGKVVIAGRISVGGTYYLLVRLNMDGTFDSSFNLMPTSSLNFIRLRRLLATADSKLLAVDGSMVRFNGDGTLDNSFARLPFGTYAGATYSPCFWFAQLADGRIVIPSDPSAAGTTLIDGQAFNGSARLLADGTLDTTFSSPVFQQDIFPTTVKFESDGRLVAAGGFDHVGQNAKALLSRLNADGTPDLSYSLGVSNASSILGFAPTTGNQSYALVGAGDIVFGSTSNLLVRLNSDGSIDPGFDVDQESINSYGYFFTDLIMQGTQPVLLDSPSPQALLNNTNFPMLRFQANGAIDPTYHCDLPVTGIVYAFDGRLLTNLAGVPVSDLGFLIMNDLQPLAMLPDGGLLAALGTTNAGNPYVYQTIRLNADGSVDHSFNSIVFSPADSFIVNVNLYGQGSYWEVSCIYPKRCLTSALIQSNGMVLVAGTFTNLQGGALRPGILRLFSNGLWDTNFPVGSGPVAAQGAPVRISGLAADGAGKVWVTGNFVRWDGFNAPGYVRLNADGSVDTNCIPQSSHYPVDDYNPNVFSGALPRGTGECFVFGPHLLPSDVWPRALTHLVPYFPPPLYPVGLLPGIGFEMTFRSESGRSYWLQSSGDLTSWQNLSGFQGTGGQMTLTDPGALLLSKHFYRVVYQ